MALPRNAQGWKDFLIALQREYERDHIGDVAGSVTFFAVLALFPFLVFLISLVSLFMDLNDVERLLGHLRLVAPQAVSQIVGNRIGALMSTGRSGALTAGAVGAVWAASGGIASLISALNRVYEVEETRPFWKVRGIAVAVTLGAAAVGILAVTFAVLTPLAARALGEGALGTAVLWLRWPVAGFLMMVMWAFLYYLLPNVKQPFRVITPGSVVGVLLWVLASYGFSIYAGHFGKYDVTYGALGGMIVLLIWMWISTQVILLGAEINHVLQPSSPAETTREGGR